MDKKFYTGTCYVGSVGSETENGQCRNSIYNIQLRPGDSLPRPFWATKGYESRQQHLDSFINETNHEFILLLDSDMVFPPHALERLRSHGLPYVSGLYMRRRFQPIAPVWFENGAKGKLPLRWFTKPWEDGKLYPLGGSGWGCVLIHREVVLAVRAILKGEKEILEDDMDLYPYDLARIMQAVNGIKELAEGKGAGPATSKVALREFSKILAEEIRPLTGRKDNINGSDVRFPFFAKLAGYQLYGDTGVQCGHMLNYPLMPSDYLQSPPDVIEALSKEVTAVTAKEVRKQNAILAQLRGENA
jgi:hypothetical protein